MKIDILIPGLLFNDIALSIFKDYMDIQCNPQFTAVISDVNVYYQKKLD